MSPKFFTDGQALRKWFIEHHETAVELWLGYYKKGSGKASVDWPESVDEALCFGWIDGVRKSIDGERYVIRFTPRKPKSIWSAVNINKIEKLTKEGKMYPKGLAIYAHRDDSRSKVYSFEQEKVEFSADYEDRFRKNTKAWDNFEKMAPSYKKPAIHWVMSAKQEETRLKRLETLMEDSENGIKVKPLRRPTDKKGD